MEMKVKISKYACLICLCLVLCVQNSKVLADDNPIILKTMGSLFFGGNVTKLDNGETFHGDHGYAQYFIPQNAYNYPVIMWHGIGQSGKSFETTPDGREGFMSILPRKGWAAYIIDQPRRGRAGRTLSTEVVNAVPTTNKESAVWDAFRNGVWNPPENPTIYEGSKFPSDPASIEQFFRQQTPDTGAEPRNLEYYNFMGQTMAELLNLTGESILLTHSKSGIYGWFSAIKSPDKVKAIIAFEPGHFVFPEGENLAEIDYGLESVAKTQQPVFISEKDFKNLTKMPILIIYGDNITKEPSKVFNENVWRISSARALEFANAVNSRGGDVKVIKLPAIGITGNTHAPFADKNNLEIANLIEKYLIEKGLNKKDKPHTGPKRKVVKKYTIPLTK